jgi:hypothetical protein
MLIAYENSMNDSALPCVTWSYPASAVCRATKNEPTFKNRRWGTRKGKCRNAGLKPGGYIQT